jgi:hypothetical protein
MKILSSPDPLERAHKLLLPLVKLQAQIESNERERRKAAEERRELERQERDKRGERRRERKGKESQLEAASSDANGSADANKNVGDDEEDEEDLETEEGREQRKRKEKILSRIKMVGSEPSYSVLEPAGGEKGIIGNVEMWCVLGDVEMRRGMCRFRFVYPSC